MYNTTDDDTMVKNRASLILSCDFYFFRYTVSEPIPCISCKSSGKPLYSRFMDCVATSFSEICGLNIYMTFHYLKLLHLGM